MKKLPFGMLLLGILLLALSACVPPPPPPAADTIVPETTKVADEATGAALVSFDPAGGSMAFSGSTAVLASLEPGDVLVGGPSGRAPYGFLRKVTAIRQEGSGIVLETTAASLPEAVHKGGFDVRGSLGPDDLAETEIHREGVRTRILPAAERGTNGPGDVISEGYRFEVAVDLVLDLDDGTGANGGRVHVSGVFRFNAGYDVGFGVEPCLRVPPACIDRFEARMGIDQYVDLRTSAELHGRIDKEIELATYHFKPIVVWIGPVPVVILPVVEAVIGATGQAELNFSFAARESTAWVVGAKWTDPADGGRGWEDLSRNNGFAHDVGTPQVDARMRLRAYGRSNGKLLFYGAAGPALNARLGGGLDVEVPRRPTWKIFGYIGMGLTFDVDIAGLLDLESFTIADVDTEFDIADAPNYPPRFGNVVATVIRVEAGVKVVLGPRAGFSGYFDVMDPEGGPLTLSASSDRDGPIPLAPTFTSLGRRTVTITARDDEGAGATAVLALEVVSSAPLLELSVAGDTVPATVQYRIGAWAYDPGSGEELGCAAIGWRADDPADTVTPLPDFGGGCEAVAVFAAPGTRTLTVTATNRYGSTTTTTLAVQVTDPPVNHPPVIDANSFSARAARGPKGDACVTGFWCEVPEGAVLYNGQELGGVLYYYPPLWLRANASDPDGDPLTFTWSCTAGSFQAPVVDNGDGTFTCDVASFPADRTVVVRVEVSDGSNTVSWFRSFITLRSVN